MFIDLKIEPSVCVACGVCIDSCPTDVIAAAPECPAYVAHLGDCQGCFLCVFDCPVDAISLTQTRVAIEEIGSAWCNINVTPVKADPLADPTKMGSTL